MGIYLQASYVFGISNDIPDNLFYVEENTILYPAGNNIILFNVEQKLQRFVPIGDQAEGITSIAVSSDRHVFAAAARSSPKPIINVYDLHTFRKRRQLTPIDNITSREFTSLSFSMDSKYLAAQCGKPEWTLHFYAWEKGKSIATISTSSVPEKAVNQISINPYDGTEICVVGQGFINIYRYSEGVLRPIHVNIPEQNFLCHCFVSIDRLVVGSEQGSLFLIKNGVFIQDLSFSNQSPVRCLQTMKQGFACGGGGGSVNVYEFKTPEKIDLLKQIPLPDAESIVTGMAATTVEGTLLAEINTNQVLKVNLSPSELSKNETLKFDSFTDTFHYGSIVGLDLCIRKPLLVTCSTDKSVRLWNYMTGTCEMVKHFGEDACSVAMHPSGLYILVGFVDKLRLMNILMDDLRPIREFSIRSCRECRFSNGGHVFAAAHGNIVQIFSTWNFDNIENLKGHNGKVKSLYWSPDDGTLVSAGSDGAVYSWKIKSMKREHEHILKSCVYNSAVCSPNGKIMYAVGSDKMIKEITESSVTKEFDAGSIQTQIAISNSGRMMFVG
ncbi:WD40-repeat-containing domain protein, partial [Gorgonomyces haynaldii]